MVIRLLNMPPFRSEYSGYIDPTTAIERLSGYTEKNVVLGAAPDLDVRQANTDAFRWLAAEGRPCMVPPGIVCLTTEDNSTPAINLNGRQGFSIRGSGSGKWVNASGQKNSTTEFRMYGNRGEMFFWDSSVDTNAVTLADFRIYAPNASAYFNGLRTEDIAGGTKRNNDLVVDNVYFDGLNSTAVRLSSALFGRFRNCTGYDLNARLLVVDPSGEADQTGTTQVFELDFMVRQCNYTGHMIEINNPEGGGNNFEIRLVIEKNKGKILFAKGCRNLYFTRLHAEQNLLDTASRGTLIDLENVRGFAINNGEIDFHKFGDCQYFISAINSPVFIGRGHYVIGRQTLNPQALVHFPDATTWRAKFDSVFVDRRNKSMSTTEDIEEALFQSATNLRSDQVFDNIPDFVETNPEA